MKRKSTMAIGMVVFCFMMMASGAAWSGNGTVTANGLVWLKNAGCLGAMNWDAAKARAATLASGQCGLTDNSAAGVWRLPTIEELKAIYSSKGQFSGVQSYYYWSSSTYALSTAFAWGVGMGNGGVYGSSKNYGSYVWPVRSGQ